MATNTNQIPRPSTENEQQAAAISEQENVHLNGFVTESDSGSDSSLYGSNFGCITPAKRRAGTRKGNPSKKRKRTQSSKKLPIGGSGSSFARRWELEDMIVVLKEMCMMKRPNGMVDEISLYNSLKGKLEGNFSMEQLKNKMKNMRTKYVMYVRDIADLDSQEAVVFGLSDKMWGSAVMKKNRARNKVENENGVDNEVRKTVVNENVDDDGNIDGTDDIVDEREEVEEKGRNFVRNYKRLCKSTIKLMKKNVDLIGKANGKELDDEWKTLWVEEMELNHKKTVLRMKQIDLVYGHIKK